VEEVENLVRATNIREYNSEAIFFSSLTSGCSRLLFCSREVCHLDFCFLLAASSFLLNPFSLSIFLGYHRYLESIIKQNPHFQIKDAAERWRALTEAERDAYNRRASQFAPSLERGKPIRDLPPPEELTAQGVQLDVLKNTDVTTEGALAVSGANMMAALAAAEQTAIDGRFSHKDMKKALLATSWSKLSDSKISAIYRRAVGYFLFCLEHQNLPALKYKPESLTKSLWMQLSEEQRLEYIERGLKTKLESGVTLWEAAGPAGSWHRWRLLFMSIARDLKMRDYNEWYDVSMKQLENFGGA
jgi:hypothetical protein